ncbi:hypothetical protein GCM10023149_15510 [Mucilaginibacter gynuensis]|uniref:PDZ domain-containing protein n=1 Tax=Mucilaginibacter gynuensis TaxID=1302236 RepID=A0ABP8G5Y2_9SPHI
MLSRPNFRLCFLWSVILLSFLTGCHKNDPGPDYPDGSDQSINKWVLDSMRVYYYWNNLLPGQPDINLEPLRFFSSIKNPADRFSLLVNPDIPLSYNPTLSSTFGIDMVTYNNGTTRSQISLVVPGSEAEQLGLKRGDEIVAVNAITLDESNIGGIIENSIRQGNISIQIRGNSVPFEITGSIVSDKPVYTYKVIKSGAKNIAYLFFNAFQERAIPELQQAFDYFKNQQANELILDMRYNAGGDVAVCAFLAAAIGPDITADAIFAEYRGNAAAGTRRYSFDKEISRLSPVSGGQFSQASALRLNISRVFILTGRHTISAAELLANNLTPYITTVRVGEQTFGKDMASFEIKDYREPVKIPKWSIHPLVFKLYNANSRGDYANGLLPDIAASELNNLPLLPFGDESDPLINAAIARIKGLSKTKALTADIPVKVLYDSRNKTDEVSAPVQVQH